MKICFVGPANSAHIIKWCDWFSSKGHEIHVVSFIPGEIPSACVHLIDLGVDTGGNDISKIKYLFSGKKIKRIVDSIGPDVVNVHYATSYGTAVALSGIDKYVLSVWGSDIYDFPNKSPFHKILLKYSLKKATYLFSTSKAMAEEASKYTSKQFLITPFGVDLVLFNADKRTRLNNDELFVVGTVKSLSDKYGIREILEAVALIKNNTTIPIALHIAGKGPKEEEYHKLSKELGIAGITSWLGFISQREAAIEWANLDLALIPSISESFGVSAVEAQACGTPVIISDCPGLMEATKPNISSVVIPRKNSKELAKAIVDLYNNRSKCEKLAVSGRHYVEENYDVDDCFNRIETAFYEYIET